ncbi:MAG TPA: 4Fe-4S binding protein [Bacillota bacterium]|nr:4Fe-4S binding protein [Candidatus Fermentithermobacillaceae bacterium]HOB29900.1 4Fe-4S binding protein [Bacillota bacterium]HOK63770.1 4Fe-4S binding protein [Bacillota bacterium]HOL11542.1 4Fe-4S binding protein [Bacillota bacterium]HOQ02599.1 4Fe-4S binding protein [Bacillota bacterium]
MDQNQPWEIIVNSKWCKKCGLCVEFCPRQVLEMGEDSPVVKDASRCIGCLLCEMHCPDFAIIVKGGGEQ